MTGFGIRTFQLAIGALALTVAGWAGAQAADTAAPASAPEAAAAKPAPKAQKHHQHKKRNYASPAEREAAAVKEEARRGRLGDGKSASQYEQNALARCNVFKTDLDRQACVGRIQNGQTSGSVEGGGTLMEYTQQVPVNQ
ncbi:hypothetical protein V8Z74_05630 [Comamonas sp. w2-DMI]|uniref:Uncharacterized protein n=1 Tax=Comamonas terrae TaxID=673548 RepID=A0ABW5UJW9_9BURK|nr:hypothetical protein [Comamonas terrae]